MNVTGVCGFSFEQFDENLCGQLSLAIPSWVGAMSTSQRAVMPCGWGVKVGMVRV